MFGNYEEEFIRRKAVIGLLLKMASSDGHYHPVEEKFLIDVATQLELTKDDIIELQADPDKYEMSPPPGEHERMTILYYVLFTMAVDGKIHESEEQMCYKIGLRLGFNEHMTRDLINVMKRYLNKEIPQNELLTVIKKHMN